VVQFDGNIEVALVSALISPASAAVYGITDRIFRTAVSFVNPIAGSVMSGLAHLVGERGRLAALKPSMELINIWSLIVAASLPALLAVNGDFTALWVGGDHYGGLPLSTALFMNEILAAREWLFSVLLIAAGAISFSAWVGTAECLIRMPIMYLAIRQIGWVGLPGAQAFVSLLALAAFASLVGLQFGIAGRKRFLLFMQGWVPLVVSVALGIVEAVALPSAKTWPQLVLKCAFVGSAHLLLALALAPAGRRALFGRLATGRLGWLGRIPWLVG
jgi:O-antigen/teichoic acid export membrane protein